MSEPTHHTATEQRSTGPAIIAILLAVSAVALMLFSFVNGISAAENGGGSGPGIYVPLFFLGAAVAVAAAVIGIVGIVRRSHRILSSIAVLISLIPGIGIVLLRLANG